MSYVPGPPPGRIDKAVGIIKGLTFQNVAIIALLLLMALPAWLTWTIINDEALLTIVFSRYEERGMPGTDCTMRMAAKRAAKPYFYISNSFGFSGNDRWYVGVNTPVEPNEADAANYCRVLEEIVEFARNPREVKPPTFPYSKRYVFPPLPEKATGGP